ncbi:TPA: hypothetical protein L4556_002035 [Pseudomonas aeruginosa]|nr:hypothetical protein [Pseudomonas aeruginosa]
MATNDFLPFAGGAGSNVLTQAAYASLSARTAGFTAGVAKSAELNKVWRQASIMSAALAQLIADNTGLDVIDDGSIATILENLKTAVGGRLLNIQVFNSSGVYTPTPGTKSVIVEVQGAGGGGGGAAATDSTSTSVSGSGGGGSYAKARINSGFSGVTVTVGAKGAGGAAGPNAGGNGGTSSFGALVSAPGGTGGLSQAAGAPPMSRGGSTYATPPSGGNIESRTGTAGGGNTVFSGSLSNFNPGASSKFGEGGIVAQAAGGPGAGGGGVANKFSSAAAAGGDGGPGLVIVWEFS